MDHEPGTAIVIPVYNSAQSLRELVSRLTDMFDDRELNIILVDDASPNPDSWKTISSLADEYAEVTGVQLVKNRGRSIAVICGLSHVREHHSLANVVIMDDDLQHRPEDAVKLVDALGEKPELDVAIAQFNQKQTRLLNRVGSRIKSWIDHGYYNLPRNIRFGPFIALNNRMLEPVCTTASHSPLIGSLVMQIASNYAGVDCDHDKRRYGVPQFSFVRRLKLLFLILLSDINLLSKLFLALGGLLFAGSLLFAAYLIVQSMVFGNFAQGWLSVFVAITFFGAVNLLAISVVFSQIAHVRNTTDNLPAWLVRQVRSRKT